MANKWISRILAVCAIATSAELAIPDMSHAQSESSRRTLGVSAIGRATAPAEKALVMVQYNPNFYNEPNPETGITLQPEVSFSDLKPVVDALIGAGISESAISSDRQDAYSQGRRLIVRVDNPTQARLQNLLNIATETTIESGKFIAGTSTVLYTVSDCDRVEKMAYEAAMSDIKERAAVVADKAGVSLGELVYVSAYTASWGGTYASSQFCPNTVEEVLGMASYGGYGYNPALPLEVSVSVNLSADYEME